jgi:hypothetical protein
MAGVPLAVSARKCARAVGCNSGACRAGSARAYIAKVFTMLLGSFKYSRITFSSTVPLGSIGTFLTCVCSGRSFF